MCWLTLGEFISAECLLYGQLNKKNYIDFLHVAIPFFYESTVKRVWVCRRSPKCVNDTNWKSDLVHIMYDVCTPTTQCGQCPQYHIVEHVCVVAFFVALLGSA